LEQRLASRLLMLAGPYGVTASQGLKIELHLSQETLAQLIGATRQRVNQVLKKWSLKASSSSDTGASCCWIDPGLKTRRNCEDRSVR
jgi:CRP-like cAMP-binding protein